MQKICVSQFVYNYDARYMALHNYMLFCLHLTLRLNTYTKKSVKLKSLHFELLEYEPCQSVAVYNSYSCERRFSNKACKREKSETESLLAPLVQVL